MKNIKFYLLFIFITFLITSSYSSVVFIGDPDSTYYMAPIPLFLSGTRTYSQTIYHESEIQISGDIYALEYTIRTNHGTVYAPDVVILMATIPVEKPFFYYNEDWIPHDLFTIVYEGSLSFGNTNDQYVSFPISLDTPFYYDGGNLVICFWSKVNNNLDDAYAIFQHYPTSPRSIFHFYIQFDPENPPSGFLNATNPNISLIFDNTELGSLSGLVSSETEPVSGVNIFASNSELSRQDISKADGTYQINHIKFGEYTITATKLGYYDKIIENVEIIPNENTNIDIEMEVHETFIITGKIISSGWNEPLYRANLSLYGYHTVPIVYTDVDGFFAIEGAYVNREYALEINASLHFSKTIYIYSDDDLNTGEIMLFEFPIPPSNIITNDVGEYINVSWRAPVSSSLIYYNLYISPSILPDTLELIANNITDIEYQDYTKNIRESGIYIYHLEAVYTNDNISELVASSNTAIYPYGYAYIGDINSTTNTNFAPISFSNRSSISQSIYHKNEIMYEGVITKLKYFFNNTDVNGSIPISIWMANIPDDFSIFESNNSWVPYADFFLVYEGYLSAPNGLLNYVYFDLDEPFVYENENLVIMAQRHYVLNDLVYSNRNNFHSNNSEARVLFRHINSPSLNPEIAYGTGTISSLVPNIVLAFDNDGYGHLSGEVTYNGIPLSSARITVNNNKRHVSTDSEGVFLFQYIPEGNINITISRHGYYNVNLNDICIYNAETTNINATMTPLSQIKISGSVAAISDRHRTDGVPPSKHINGETPFVQNKYTPIEGAFIQLTGYTNYGTLTDNNGNFTFPNVYTPFTYTITITKDGYKPYINDLLEIGYSDVNLDTIILIPDIVSITDPEIIPIEKTVLHNNYPNPFNPSTNIRFDLAENDRVVINIFNIRGQKVKTLIDSYFNIGRYNIEWNGTDNNNKLLPSGVYFYIMNLNGNSFTKKMVMVK